MDVAEGEWMEGTACPTCGHMQAAWKVQCQQISLTRSSNLNPIGQPFDQWTFFFRMLPWDVNGPVQSAEIVAKNISVSVQDQNMSFSDICSQASSDMVTWMKQQYVSIQKV